MGYKIKQGNASRVLAFLLISASDHITGLTGVSPTVTISKNGGPFSTPAGPVSEIGNGWYAVAANALDADTLGPLLLHAAATGSDPLDEVYEVVAYNPDDAQGLGLVRLDDSISHIPANVLGAIVPHSTTANTVARCLQIARAQGLGSWTIANDLLTLYDTDGTTAIGSFALLPSGGPYTQRLSSPE